MLKLDTYLNELEIKIRKKTPKPGSSFTLSPAAQAAMDKANEKPAKPTVRRGKEYVFSYKGKWVIDTKHASERVIQRGQLTKSEMETLYKRMIDSNPSNDGTYLFSSKSLDQTLVVGLRPDYRSGSEESQFIIITFLPRGKHFSANPKDTKVIVESETIQIDYSVELG